MKILFPYLARWRSANRSRYHQLLTHLCDLGHQVYVLKAPPMALNDISARDIESESGALPPGLELSEISAPAALRAFWSAPIPRTKVFKKGLLSIASLDQVRRFVEREQIDVLLVYNLPQVLLLGRVECHRHFDLADDLVAMMKVEHQLISRFGGAAAARAVERRLLDGADTVTVASQELAERIEREVLLLPNGADPLELDRADPSAWRARASGPTVGFVGAFEYWVDFDLILALARRLPRVNFLLVGGGRRLPLVRRQVERGGLTNVHLTGPLPYESAMNYAAGMDVCLLPFTRDAVSHGSCPLKLFEYAALRRPVISTRTREVERVGSGWVTFADDPVEMAAAIEFFLADPREAARVGAAGRAAVEQTYNWPRLARRFSDLLTARVGKPAKSVARSSVRA
jgi:glycosyltransferase involved in cell wall biosynthesis